MYISRLYSPRPVFYGNVEKSRKMLTSEEKMQKLTKATVDSIRERCDKEMPKKGHFRDIVGIYTIPDTQNDAVMKVKHNITAQEDKRIFEIGATRSAGDRMISMNLFEGTSPEVKEYLKGINTDELVKKLKILSDKVDFYYSDNIY